MKYLIDEEEVSQEEFDSRLEEEVSNYVDEHYDEIIDECYPEVEIGVCRFYASQILRELDPVAYSCGVSDEESFKMDEVRSDLESGDEVDLNGVTFRIEDSEDE